MLFRKKKESSSSTSTIPRIGGLPATRKGALLLALVCAGAAAIILVVAVGQYKQSSAPPAVQDTVLVATHVIQKGTSGETIAQQQMYESTPVSAKNLAVGALTNAAALQGVYATNTILPGQQLTAADFAAKAGAGIVSELSPNERAITVQLDSQHENLGVVQTGEYVDVYGSFTVPPEGNVVRLLATDIPVLRAPAADPTPGSTGSTATGVVLGVSQLQAPDIAYAQDYGKLWLVLRPANATPTSQLLTVLKTEVYGLRQEVNVVNGKIVIGSIPGLVPNAALPPVSGRQWLSTASGKGKK